MSDVLKSQHLISHISSEGTLTLRLEERDVPTPAADEVVVQVQAAPINPSDLALLLGPVDPSQAQFSGTPESPEVSIPVPAPFMAAPSIAGRLGQSLGVGNEGAGVVVRAGSSPQAQALLGKTVATIGGDMFATYRCVNVMMVMPMADGVSADKAASSFVNPMTAQGMVETMRDEGFKAIVHTAAASNLGQMLNRLCLAEGINVINIVRKPEQAEILKALGARYIVNSSDDSFYHDLTKAIIETEAYLAFDATGGGRLANDILLCMENAAARGQEWSRYGTETLKKVYVYGKLDMSPLELTGAYGLAFSVSGWLLLPFLQRIGWDRMTALQQRVSRELDTTFASEYAAEISLRDALTADAMSVYAYRTTGKKYLINPSL